MVQPRNKGIRRSKMTQQQFEDLQEWGRNKSRDFMYHHNEEEMDREYRCRYHREYYHRKKDEAAELELAEQLFIEEIESYD